MLCRVVREGLPETVTFEPPLEKRGMVLRQGMTNQKGGSEEPLSAAPHFLHMEQIRNKFRELVNLSKVEWLEVEGLGREATFLGSLVPLSPLH